MAFSSIPLISSPVKPAAAARPRSTLHRLRRAQFVTLRPQRGQCVRAERGTLWVTVDGRLRDIELDPGQRHVFDSRDTAVLGSLGGDAVFSLTPPAAPSWLERLLGGWGRAARQGAA